MKAHGNPLNQFQNENETCIVKAVYLEQNMPIYIHFCILIYVQSSFTTRSNRYPNALARLLILCLEILLIDLDHEYVNLNFV